MVMRSFGSGTMYITRTDVPNSSPIKFGDLQDGSVDFEGSTKEVYGEGQFPVAVGRATGKITGSAKTAQIQSRLMADNFFGTPLVKGRSVLAKREAGMVPSVAVGGVYSVAVANAVNFQKNLGVVYAATGVPLQQVATNPAAGQYTATANGIYDFAAADEGVALLFDYLWEDNSSGQTMTYSNPDQGVQPVFSLALNMGFTGPSGRKSAILNLAACISSKLSLATKQGDFMIPQFDFSGQQDDGGTIFWWSFDEAQ